MIRILVIYFVTIFPNIAVASTACDDLWLSRNVIYDLHGYCFGSTLGKTVFDNTDCTTVEPALPEELVLRVQNLWSKAKELECKADQGRTKILAYNIAVRKTIMHQPIATLDESACIGYQATSFDLFDAPNEGATKLGTVDQGDDIGWFHEDEGDWSFLTLLKKADSSTPLSGWSRKPEVPKCDAFAG
jgi:hypothetical protein